MGPAAERNAGVRRNGTRIAVATLIVAFTITLLSGAVAAEPKAKAKAEHLTQTIDFSLPDEGIVGDSLELEGTTSSGLPLEYRTKPKKRCAIEDGELRLIARGACRVTAMQAGDEGYAPAEVEISIEIVVAQDVEPKVRAKPAPNTKKVPKAKAKPSAAKAKPVPKAKARAKAKAEPSAAKAKPVAEARTKPTTPTKVEPELQVATERLEPAATLPVLSLVGDAAYEGTGGTRTLTFTANLSAPAGSEGVKFKYATFDGTATDKGGDYLPASDSASILPGGTSVRVLVTIYGDTLIEDDEQFGFVVDGSSVTGAKWDGNPVYGTIWNDDGTPTLTINGVNNPEGDRINIDLRFRARLSHPSSSAVAFDWATADDTAIAGEDYLTAGGTVTIASGGELASIYVTVFADDHAEPHERFEIVPSNLKNVSYNAAGSDPYGTILNDDGPPPALSVTGNTRDEPNSSDTRTSFRVSLSPAATQPVTVHYETASGTATAGSDYVSASGDLLFAVGDTGHWVGVTVKGDTLIEPDETFSLTLSEPTNAVIAGASATVTIIDNDVALSIDSPAVIEGDSADTPLVFSATLAQAVTHDVDFEYTTEHGTASEGTDYRGVETGPVTIPEGEMSAKFEIDVHGDEEIEPDETVHVWIEGLRGATFGGNPVVGTILADDGPILRVFGSAVDEADAVLPFSVQLSEPSYEAVEFHYETIDVTATANSDYVYANDTYVIPGNQGIRVGPLPFTVLNDSVDEPGERFEVVISQVSGAIYDAEGSYPYGDIGDDDPAPTATPTPAPTDTTAPALTMPRVDIAKLGLTRTTRPIPLRVTFTAADPSGIADTRLQHRVGSGAFAEVPLASARAVRATVRVSKNKKAVHRFRSQARDAATPSNTSPFKTTPAFKVRVQQDGARAVRQKGTWSRKRSSSSFGGSVRATTRRGAQQKLTATGTDFAIVSTQGRNRGKAKVLIDGRRVATIDLFASKTQPRKVVFSKSFASAGKHTIVLKAMGSKNRRSQGKRVDLDAFIVLTRP